MSEILTVFGATGQQGGSVVRYVQAHPVLSKQYKIRAVTRDPSKESGQKLAAAGAEVVKGDLNDSQSLASVIQGSSTVFAVTNFWEKTPTDTQVAKETEIAQGKAIADAAKSAGVKHLIWSSLAHVKNSSNGKLSHVLHFDGKAEIEAYIRSLGINASFFMPAAFMPSILGNIKGSKKDDGYSLALPFGETDTMPMIDPVESGKWVVGMLLAGDKIYGKQVAAASGFYTGPQLADAVAKATGQPAKFIGVPEETFKGFFPDELKSEMTEMMLYIRDYGYFGPPDPEKKVEEGKKVMDGTPTSWEDYVKANM